METQSEITWMPTIGIYGGVYARTGIELKLGDGYWMGLGVRAFSSRLDFDSAADKTDVEGAQFLITYTFGI